MPEAPVTAATPPPLEFTTSRGFLRWMDQEYLSLAFTTYQTNRLFFIGLKKDGKLAGFERLFDRAMGLWVEGDHLFMSSRYQVWRFENALANDELYNDCDRLFIPRIGHTTGDLDIHDLAVDRQGSVIFVNCLFSCLATLSGQYSFKPVWKPPFISKLAPEDRCHLNGLAMRDGEPRYVTAVSRSDVSAGWRQRRDSGGVLMDIRSNEVILEGLSMPHSPRWYKDRLWLLNSGTGDFGWVDLKRGVFEPIAFCPGYLRGLAFYENYAVVGLSKPRDRAFSGLELDRRMAQKEAEPRCGFMVIDLNTGDVVHWLEMQGIITELYDVQVLPGVRRPMALGQRTDEICRLITVEPENGQPPAERNIFIAPLETKPPRAAAPSGQGAGYQYHTFDNIGPKDVAQYEAFSFPSIRKRWQVRPPKGPLTAVAAASGNQLAGAALAEIQPDAAAAEVISLFVAPDCRRRGVGGRLLGDLEQAVARKGCRAVHLTFRSDWKAREVIEKLLEKHGWSAPQVVRVIGKSNAQTVGGWPWLNRLKLPEAYTIFPWTELTQRERRSIEERQEREEWFPRVLTPFQEEQRLEPINSIGLRHDGRVVGWMITHRTTPDTIQYTSLFVDAGIQGLGRGIALVAEAINRQIRSGVAYGIFMADVKNERMVNFARRRLRPYLLSLVESYYTQKLLGPAH